MLEMLNVFLFTLILLAATISYFVKKFYVVLPTKLLYFVFNLSRSSFFSVIHVKVDIKIVSKERSSFVTPEKLHCKLHVVDSPSPLQSLVGTTP